MAKPQNLSGEIILRNVVEYLIRCGKNEAAALLVGTEMTRNSKNQIFY